jgi:hypothetical protein
MDYADALQLLRNLGPGEWVGKWDDMDLTSEELLFSSKDLRNGMVVVLGDPYARVELNSKNTSDPLIEKTKYRTKVTNRWCVVSNVEIVDHGMVAFIATYSDGQAMRRDIHINYSWWVKKDSIPEEPIGPILHYVTGSYSVSQTGDGMTVYQFTEISGRGLQVVLPADYAQNIVKLHDNRIISGNQVTMLSEILTPEPEPMRRHDPDWAIKNLQRSERCSFTWQDAGGAWASRCIQPPHLDSLHVDVTGRRYEYPNADPNPTRTDIPVFAGKDLNDRPTGTPRCLSTAGDALDAGTTYYCNKQQGHTDEKHVDKHGRNWPNENYVPGPKTDPGDKADDGSDYKSFPDLTE